MTTNTLAVPEAPAPAPSYDPALEYHVRLLRPCTVGTFPAFLPLYEHRMSGAFLTRLITENGADVVEHATPVAD